MLPTTGGPTERRRKASPAPTGRPRSPVARSVAAVTLRPVFYLPVNEEAADGGRERTSITPRSTQDGGKGGENHPSTSAPETLPTGHKGTNPLS